MTLITAPDRAEVAHAAAKRHGCAGVIVEALTRDNYVSILDPLLPNGGFLYNVSVDVSSCALMEFCSERNVLYLDTVVEPWAGGYTDPRLSMSQRTNYGQREDMISLKRVLGPDVRLVCLRTSVLEMRTYFCPCVNDFGPRYPRLP